MNKDESGELGTQLVQETLDSIDEVCRCQGPKVELSCFFLKHPYSIEIILLPFHCGSLFVTHCLHDITFSAQDEPLFGPHIISHGLRGIIILLSALAVSFNLLF